MENSAKLNQEAPGYTGPEEDKRAQKELNAVEKTSDSHMKEESVKNRGKRQKRQSINLEKQQVVVKVKEERSDGKDGNMVAEEIEGQVSGSGAQETKTPERKSNFPKKNTQYCGTGRMPCPYLGEGWHFEQIVRQQGKSAGNYDTYYYSPKGLKIRSKLKLQQFVGKDLKNFDFNAGEVKGEPQEVSTQSQVKTKPAKKFSLKTNQIKTVQPSVILDERKQLKHDLHTGTLKSPQKRKRGRPPLVCRLPPVKRALKKRKVTAAEEAKPEEVAVEVANENTTEPEPESEVVSEKIPDKKIDAFERFRKAAAPHAELLLEDTAEVEALLKCCWECLDDEGQKHYETSFSEMSKRNPSTDETSVEGTDTDDHTEQKTQPQNNTFTSEMSSPPVPLNEGCRKLMPSMPRKKRCGVCTGCTATNCGMCIHCRDMKKFGGSGSKKQSCVQRRCVAIHAPNGKGILVPDMYIRNAYEPGSPPFLNNPANYEGSLYWGQETKGRELSRLGRMNRSFDDDMSGTCFPYANSIEIPSMVAALGETNEFIERDYPLTRTAYRSKSAELSPENRSAMQDDVTQQAFDKSPSDTVTTEQRPHKRKSRQPMCIKQTSADNDKAETNMTE